MSLQAGMDIQELKQELLEQVKVLSKQGLLPGLTDAVQLVNDVIKQLQNDKNVKINPGNLNSKETKDVLQIAIMGQHLNKASHNLTLTPENQKLLREELVRLLTEKLEENPELKEKLKNKETRAKVEKFLRLQVDRILGKEPQNAELLTKVMDSLRLIAQGKFLESGKDQEYDKVKEDLETRYNFDIRGGGAARPIFVITAGRELGQLDLDNNPTSYSFSGRENTPDYGRLDPMGTVWATILNFVSANIDGSLEYELDQAGKLENDRPTFNPTPTPYGTKTK